MSIKHSDTRGLKEAFEKCTNKLIKDLSATIVNKYNSHGVPGVVFTAYNHNDDSTYKMNASLIREETDGEYYINININRRRESNCRAQFTFSACVSLCLTVDYGASVYDWNEVYNKYISKIVSILDGCKRIYRI